MLPSFIQNYKGLMSIYVPVFSYITNMLSTYTIIYIYSICIHIPSDPVSSIYYDMCMKIKIAWLANLSLQADPLICSPYSTRIMVDVWPLCSGPNMYRHSVICDISLISSFRYTLHISATRISKLFIPDIMNSIHTLPHSTINEYDKYTGTWSFKCHPVINIAFLVISIFISNMI